MTALRQTELSTGARGPSIHKLTRPGLPSTPLRVSKPHDVYEQEADRIAEEVMRMPQSATGGTTPARIPTSSPNHAGKNRLPVQRHCEECAQTTRVDDAASDAGRAGAATIPVLRASGEPLPHSQRGFFEQHFGVDFGGVRIHNGPKAAAAARTVHARAFTVGHDVVFGSGEFAPETRQGARLLAHELTHVAQQNQRSPTIQRQDDGEPAPSSPAALVEAYTSITGLDETGLGVYLFALAASSVCQINFVMNVIASVDSGNRDEVAYAFVSPLIDSQIDQFARTSLGSQLLAVLRNAMTGGVQTDEETNEIGRIDASLRSLKSVLGGWEKLPAVLPPTPTATIILVGAPTRPGDWDQSPYNYSGAAVEVIPKILEFSSGSQITILLFTPGYKSRGVENGANVYERALADLQGTGATVVEVESAPEVVNFLNTGLISPAEDAPTRAVMVSRFFYFGHGTSSALLLEFGWGSIHYLDKSEIVNIKTEAFKPRGRSYLFTCHIAEGGQSFMSVWASHLGQEAIGPQGTAAFNAEYGSKDLDRAINEELPQWFLGLPYMNRVKIIDNASP